MAIVDVEIGNRKYQIACRSGEEAHLREVAAIVDRKAQEAAGALGSLGEARQLLFASLLLADELHEQKAANAQVAAPAPGPIEDYGVTDALERLAARMESLANRLEADAPDPYIGG